MIVPTNGTTAWTSIDADQLLGFLQTSTGQRLLSTLVSKRPKFHKFSSIEERAVQSGVVEGYEECLTDIDSLTRTKSE